MDVDCAVGHAVQANRELGGLLKELMVNMEWKRLLSAKRVGKTQQSPPGKDGRSKFDSDVDRITYCGAFRRLSRKTQVHPLAGNDHVHNRMTHSLEVARVGFALGKALGAEIEKHLPKSMLPSDVGTIVHAACLAHDIGNPPFGHAGESAIKEWFLEEGPTALESSALTEAYKNDLYHFEGNAQGFRVLTQLENHVFQGGLQLTCATLATFLKYPWDVRKKSAKFSVYLSEAEILKEVATEVGLVPSGEGAWCRHPLAYLVEAADDICYGIVDLEDAVELKILTFDQVLDVLTKSLTAAEREAIKEKFTVATAFRVNLSRLRGALFDRLVQAAVQAFLDNYDAIMAGTYSGDLFAGLGEEHPDRGIVEAAKKLAGERVYTVTRKVELELGCSSTFACLLDAFCGAALKCSSHLCDKQHTSIDRKSKLVLRLLGDHSPLETDPPSGDSWNDYQCVRRALDFVGGMTDNYAVYVAQQIQGTSLLTPQRQ